METIRIKARVCISRDHRDPSEWNYYFDDYSEVNANTHVVWIEADVPVGPTPIRAEVTE